MASGASDMTYLKIFPYHIDKQKSFFYFKFSSCHSVSTLSGDFESLSISAHLTETNMAILETDIEIKNQPFLRKHLEITITDLERTRNYCKNLCCCKMYVLRQVN